MVLNYLLLFLVVLSATTSAAAARKNQSLPGCPTSCGNVSNIPYPFGIKPGCFRSTDFQLTCSDQGKLFLGDNNSTSEVIELNLDYYIYVKAPIFIMPANDSSYIAHWTPLKGGPYTISYNSFIVVGCDISATLTDSKTGNAITCRSVCDSNHSMVPEGTSCTGLNGCCSEILTFDDMQSFEIQFERLQGGGQANGKAFVMTSSYRYSDYTFSQQDLISPDLIGGSSVVPLELDWWITDNSTCEEAKRNMSTYACRSSNSRCVDQYDSNMIGYRCYCYVYDGNPYIGGGCPGSGRFAKFAAFCRTKRGIGVMVSVGVSIGFSLLFVSTRFLYRRWKKIILKRDREKHFHKNRGLLLQQLISSDNDIAERTKIFSLDELAKATNNFDEARVLGRGGHGTVFKGILSDQRVVAIKKSKINVQSEIDQFLNEVVILSQINHRNVVKLFGCCLETEVPLLVYEFVSNGTLSDHLHLPDRRSSLSWEERLSIARDASGALSYLHSEASISIFHRDVKSSNILLDDHCTAKVSDFGVSRSIPFDMTRVVTVVQGTFGYLDPEYYRTGQLTEKSDVYSFGVILVELLTGEKPISFTRPEEERNLCTHFLSALEDGRISQIVEARVIEEATREDIDSICRLAEMCLRSNGEDRPTMKGVAVSLEGLRRSKTRKSTSLLPNSDPQTACSEEMPGGSNSSEQPMLSITVPR